MSEQVEHREFQAEARQLLQLMVHSIYSNKDSFLRELISNASDALDKLRLEAFRDKDLDVDTSDLHIDVDIDGAARTLTVRDNGIGMTRDEVVDLIGTLAKSGTAELRNKLREAQQAGGGDELIGQFGIGFYSTFMVADAVELVTRKAGESSATRWESSGDGTYTIATVDDAPQGTSVKLHLKPEDADDEMHDYTSPWKIKELVKKYSDFISWPIRMEVEKTGGQEQSDSGDVTVPPAEEGAEPTVTVETETINSRTALWAKPKAEVSAEEYAQFYKHIAHAWDEPLDVIAMKAEGTFEYQALLFIPSMAPFDLFNRDGHTGIQLYVKRVFIMGDCDDLMPEYLRFVKGVVDAQDMSLNVSREILQQDRQIKVIRRSLTKKVLSAIKDLQATRTDDYATFWSQFGRVFKEGLLSDADNRDTLLRLSSFTSTFSESTTLADYVGRMKDGQDQIFFATGESRQLLERSPHLEAFKAKGFEVLLLTDPVDEVWVESVPEFDGKTLQSVAKGEVDLGASDAPKDESDHGDFAALLSWLQETLDEHVKEVRLSTRLTSSPACLITDTFGITPQLARMYRASGQEVPVGKRILELNPDHPLVTGLRDALGQSEQSDSLAETAELLYGTALLAEGGALEDPARFAALLADRLARTV
ncbi:chaperone protein HtpG [Mycobacterium antarcticum]|uniref:molecular chaperone HtpG n=1 Tax=unclassified Mycolicibacterium TaxID=2636767 RepID=UPI00238CBD4D|nr:MULTISPECIES: molecular chaperone HtpG [unclassified Mycolicibacterium]GLP77087.1 chaperone protein HtpG [Mycolicibacterium sp. TUM20983]GLP82491.1 chaperone protein HtpG [Mycolicibacterium sp. TUM20984]